MKQAILVLGKNYSTPLGVIRSLGKAGYPVDMLYISRKTREADIVKACKYLNRLEVVDEENDEKVHAALLNHFPSTKDRPYVLFPTDDYSASFIDRYSSALQDYVTPRVMGNSVTAVMDKTYQSRLAQQVGFQTAREWIVDLNADPLIIPKDIPFPCFVKPLISAKGGKLGIAKCDTPKALETALLRMQAWQRDRCVLVQEYLNITQEYTMGGVCCDQEVYLPGVIKKDRIAQRNHGITLAGTMTDTGILGDDLKKIIAYLRQVRYVGMFDLEVMETDRGLFFGELNLRCGGPSYAYERCGVNLPLLAVQTLCGEGLHPGPSSLSMGASFLNNKVAWEDYAFRFLSGRELIALHQSADFTLLANAEDPQPEKAFYRIMKPVFFQRRMKETIKKCLKTVRKS